jgi:DNA-binding NtrC family response regulator
MQPKDFAILGIDDEESMRSIYRILFREYTVHLAETLDKAEAVLRKTVLHLVLLDLTLPDGDGMTFLATMRKQYPHSNIIVITSDNMAPRGVRAMKLGAADYIVKPFDDVKIKEMVHGFYEYEKRLHELWEYSGDEERALIGESPAMLKVKSQIVTSAQSDAPVLIKGDSGTGKELVARAIHLQSARKNKPFVAVNCGALSKTLLASELFGHEKGAFTGATAQRKGCFETADGGTLFLDEICSLPPDAQVGIMRVLQEKTFNKVGSEKEQTVDVRIIAATNSDLNKLIESQQFRLDLFYRLNVLEISMPTLNERGEDISLLAQYFLLKFSRLYHKPGLRFSSSVETELKMRKWAGNVRELENLMHRLVVNTPTDCAITTIESLGFGADMTGIPSTSTSLAEAKRTFARQYVTAVLKQNDGDYARTAEAIGASLSTVYRILES